MDEETGSAGGCGGMTFIQAAESEIQLRFQTEYIPSFSRELALLSPRFHAWTGHGRDEQWIGVICDHPKYPRVNWFDPPRKTILIRYRLGVRHQWLLGKNGREWALRRVELLMRLLLRRLAREVAKVNG